MTRWSRLLFACSSALCLFHPWAALASNSIHTTWLWHLHQPIYWPDRRGYGTDHYEAVGDTIQQQDALRPHPKPEVLRNIFGLDDRVNAYQGRPSAALGAISSHLNFGAQVSYSGALMENVQSLGAAGQLGYGSGWYLGNRNARTWTTTGGKPRMDLVNFTYHHALAPLLSDETLEMELRIHRRQMEIFWTTTPALSRGYFPAETCFSERMIPILKRVGIDWSVIANTHLARACADFPVVVGSGGENCDLPNLADQLNPAQGVGNYHRESIDRGCSPIQVMPFGFQLHYARYVDPATGTESKLILVPSDQVLGWKDSYSQWGLDMLNLLNDRNDPAKPALVMCAHDGDNAWSGGYTYYMEWLKTFADSAASKGYEPTTVEQFLQEFPPSPNDIVHVEDGGWVYADSDFGSPMFINWHWPPSYSTGSGNVVDPSLGTSDKADNWRVILATENRVKTAQQIAGVTSNVDQVRDPGTSSTTPHRRRVGLALLPGQPRQRIRLLRLPRRRMPASRHRSIQRRPQRQRHSRGQSLRRHHAPHPLPATTASVESGRHELRCAVRLQADRPDQLRLLGLDLRLRRVRGVECHTGAPRQRHQPADLRSVQDLRGRPPHRFMGDLEHD